MHVPLSNLEIEGKMIGKGHPTYFIADIAANHDGSLERAKDLIFLANAGADAAKFQHFRAESIVSDRGFKSLNSKLSHQANWSKSVFEVYQAASLNLAWTETLKNTCKQAGITFLTTPYALDIVEDVDPHVPAYKIGSGDITWVDLIERIATKQKPIFMATGASTMDEVCQAADIVLAVNPRLALMQCNTNYTGSLENFNFIQLNVLKSYSAIYPDMILGLSDHTPGHATVLGAVALGARIVEKHFTDSVDRLGPDHRFSMNPASWREMVERTRELENALGTGLKKIEENETETVVLQRRCLRLVKDMNRGDVLCSEDLEPLRPCPKNAVPPNRIGEVIGRKLRQSKERGDHLTFLDIE